MDLANQEWYSENTYLKQVRKGRGTTRMVNGRVKVWVGEVEVALIPNRRRIYELGSRRLVKEWRMSTEEAMIRYWTEGVILEFRGARFGRDELTHLGAAMIRAAGALLGIDSSSLEIQRLGRWMSRQKLIIIDRGAPTGSAKQMFDHVDAVLVEVGKRLLGSVYSQASARSSGQGGRCCGWTCGK